MFGTAHSFGTCTLGIFGNSGPLAVSVDGAASPVRVGIAELEGVGAAEDVLGLENRLEVVCGAACGVDTSFTPVDDDTGPVDEKFGKGLNKLLDWDFSPWVVWEKMPVLGLD